MVFIGARPFSFALTNPTCAKKNTKTFPEQMEVGIEDCLHIEFEYNKGSYQLKDTVVGKIYFLLVS